MKQEMNYALLKRVACACALILCVIFGCALQMVINGTEPVFGGIVLVFVMLVLPLTVLMLRIAFRKQETLKKGA